MELGAGAPGDGDAARLSDLKGSARSDLITEGEELPQLAKASATRRLAHAGRKGRDCPPATQFSMQCQCNTSRPVEVSARG